MKKLLLSALLISSALISKADDVNIVEPFAFNGTGSVQTQSVSLLAGRSFVLTARVKFDNWVDTDNKNTLHTGDWGTAILATGTNPTADNFGNAFQLWLNNPTKKNNSNLTLKNSSHDGVSICNDVHSDADGVLDIVLTYDAYNKMMTTSVEGTQTTISNYNMNAITSLCTNVKSGITIDVSIVYPYTVEDLLGKVFKFYNETNGYLTADVSLRASDFKVDAQNAANRKVCYSTEQNPGVLFEIAAASDASPMKGYIRSISGSINLGTVNAGHGTGVDSEAWMAANGNDVCFTFKQAWAQPFDFYPSNVDAENPVMEIVYEGNNKYLSAPSFSTDYVVFNIQPAESLALSFGDDNKYLATTLPVDVTVPSDVAAFVVTGEKNGAAELSQVTGTISRNTPFLAFNRGGVTTYDFPIINAGVDAQDDAAPVSILKGYPSRITGLTSGDFYVLDAENYKFSKSEATSVGLGVPYILKSSLPGYDGDALTLPESDPTSISELTVGENAEAQAIYDLQGRRLAKPVRGLNIINGRKILL